MSTEYIQKEVSKIIEQNLDTKGFALASAWIIANFKGLNIKIYHTQNSSSLCDYNVIASVENTIQAKSMIGEIEKNFRHHGAEIISLEGLAESEWILLDIGDVIVHLFQETSRDTFDLDDLWKDSPQVSIPHEYYFGGNQEKTEKTREAKQTPENYF